MRWFKPYREPSNLSKQLDTELNDLRNVVKNYDESIKNLLKVLNSSLKLNQTLSNRVDTLNDRITQLESVLTDGFINKKK